MWGDFSAAKERRPAPAQQDFDRLGGQPVIFRLNF
jgi:hypothetical protein